MTMEVNKKVWCSTPWRYGWGILFLILIGLSPLMKADEETNLIKKIKIVDSKVEIEIYSTKKFRVQNELILLRIGEKEFASSRSPEDGSLNTLIFILPREEFRQLKTGDRIHVKYGQGEPGGHRSWDFGTLDKSKAR